MAKAKKLPSGNYRCRASFTDAHGIRHAESFTEPTAVLAEAKAAMWKAGMLERDKDIIHVPLGNAIDNYIDVCRATGLSPSTIKAYASYRKNAYPRLINMQINRIALRDIQAWIVDCARTSSPKTIRNYMGLLSVVLKSNQISMDFSLLKLPKAKRIEMEIPTDQQVKAMLDDVYDDDDMFIAVSLAAIMGLRRSEICALHWSDITVRDGVASLTVSKALVQNEDGMHVEKEPKTAAGWRTLIIPDALYEEFKRRRQLRPTLVSISPNAITERYMRLADRIGAPRRFHNLRHYHASVLMFKGATKKYIVNDMGHASFDMVERVYGHVMATEKALLHEPMNEHANLLVSRNKNHCHANCHNA